MAYEFERYGIDSALEEERELARLATHLDATQQAFFQGAYSRHRRSPRTALTLCLLLGGFGAHAFYLGRVGSAALRLLFCWTLIPALIALCESPRITTYTHDYNIALARKLVGMIDALRVRPIAAEFAPVGARAAIAAAPTAPLREYAAPRAGEPIDPHGVASVAAASVPLMAALTLPALAAEHLEAHEETLPVQQPTPFFAANYDRQAYPSDEANLENDDDALYGPAPVFAYSVATPRRSPVRLEPLPAIEEPLQVAASEPSLRSAPQTAPTFTPRRRLQRITVRKVALIDGDIVAEASATREAQMDADPEVFAERVRVATDEARIDALRQLAAIAPEEVVQRARKEFDEASLRTSTDAN